MSFRAKVSGEVVFWGNKGWGEAAPKRFERIDLGGNPFLGKDGEFDLDLVRPPPEDNSIDQS